MKLSNQPWFRVPASVVLLGFLLAATACSTTKSPRDALMGEVLPAPDSTGASGAYDGGTNYRIGAQDLVEVSVFGVKDLSKQVRVNSNGQISLPLIGAVMAGGKTIPELEAEIAARFADGYLQDPQVSVFVKEFTSQRVTMGGAVNGVGIYPITGKTTLLQALSIAGGLSELADPGGIVLFRTIDGKRMAAVYDVREITAGRMEDPEIYGDDIIMIEQSGSRTAMRRIIETFPILGLFGAY